MAKNCIDTGLSEQMKVQFLAVLELQKLYSFILLKVMFIEEVPFGREEPLVILLQNRLQIIHG